MPCEAVKEDPIKRVVVLIKELQAKIEADGKAEQKTYDKFACWCEKTLARKAAAIDAAKETIEKTQREIVELKGRIGELGATIKQLEKEIKENEEAQKEATEIREKEHEDYEQERTESEQCIGALEAAIKVLTGAGTKKAELQTLQVAQLMSVVAGVKSVLRRVPESSALSQNDLTVVNDFVADPAKFVSTGFSGAQTGTESTNPFGDYAPASTQIQGIMKGMYDSFTADLEKANAEEADKQKAFEELMATKQAELATLTATLEAKTKEHADAEKQLADDKVLLQDTKAQLEADEKFFEETKASCKAKAAEWAERTRLRTEEIQGIAKAIEILEGGAETFKGAYTSFIQVSRWTNRDQSEMEKDRNAAYSMIQKLVKKGGGLRLALLAAEVRSGGHFDKIIIMIDKMIADLRVEEQEDIKARDMCNNQENALKAQGEDAEYNIKKKEGVKERQEAKKAEVIKAKEATQDEIAIAKTEMDEMLAARNKETADFKKALKDDTDAVALLEQAIASITKFYTDNKIPLELVQREPEYTVDEDKAPEAFGDGGYGGRKSESTGIIAILSMLKEDLEKEINVAREEEAAAQAEYEKLRGEAQDGLDAMKEKETALKGEEAELDGKIADTETAIDGHKEVLENTDKQKDALKPSCEWVKNTFDSRREKRKAEIGGLEEAKALLAGARPGFLQGNFLGAQ
eukprot:gnl/MRDRNA2_/MRDRNA2_86631_c0_seq12.p1 gnl/MRDRNA2_/MRDRNA2_86631_c0~~gnl/MRDRNA2_/MRDRNA2_86631_c0_seq12.p1  ORF type:complete len:731 (+),score=256.99 gnl/MRDRNA2_/MRDRNA2_86631_c0_seq12:120-2195(+)